MRFLNLRYSILTLVGILFLSGDVSASDWTLINPTSGNKATLNVSKKNWSYWEIADNNSVVVKVTGPTRLRVYTRSAIPEKRSETLFGLISERDSDKQRLFIGRATNRDKDVKNPKKSKQLIGNPRNIYYNVPAGEHTYVFSVQKGTKQPVYARFFSETKKESSPLIAFSPRRFSNEVPIIVNEREYIYYRTDNQNSIELEVSGPTQLRVISRLEFDHTMRGDRSYRLQIMQNDKLSATKVFTGRVSGTAAYKDQSTLIIGRGDSFDISVPVGKHKITVFTPDAGVTSLLTFYIPQKDLQLSDKSNK